MTTTRTARTTVAAALALMALAACTAEPEPAPTTSLPARVETAPPAPVEEETTTSCAAMLEQYKAEFAAFYDPETGAMAGANRTNESIAAAQDRHVEMGASLVENDCYLEFEEYGKFAIGVAMGEEQGG